VRELVGKLETDKIVKGKISFKILVISFFLMFLWFYLLMIGIGFTGIPIILVGFFISLNLWIHGPMTKGIILIFLGFIFLISNFKDYISRYK